MLEQRGHIFKMQYVYFPIPSHIIIFIAITHNSYYSVSPVIKQGNQEPTCWIECLALSNIKIQIESVNDFQAQVSLCFKSFANL